jgi:DNA processing protein
MNPVTDAERLALVTLTRLGEPGDRNLVRLVDEHGAEAVVAAIRSGTLPGSRQSYATRLPAAHPETDLAHAERIGARFVCPGDLEWPTQLDQLGEARPLGLWVRGAANLRVTAIRSVALVGARAATDYGEHVAAEIASVIAERGWTVVSGAAYGVDSAAHRGALAVGGSTIAILACGVDVAYPRSNAGLLARIADEGLVVSELAPGCSVTRSRFLERNRVIAAITRGTVVVEAAIRSGARSTATHALNLDRFVMAVPGPVTSAASAGCHELLRQNPGAAHLVTDGAEVLDLVGELGVDAAPERHGPDRVGDGLDPVLMRVLEALPVRRAAGVDNLVRSAGLDVPTILRSLTQLEELGLARRRGGGWVVNRSTGDAPAASTDNGTGSGTGDDTDSNSGTGDDAVREPPDRWNVDSESAAGGRAGQSVPTGGA